MVLTLFKMGGGGQKGPRTNFSNLILVLTPFPYCCKISRPYLVSVPDYLTLTKTTLLKKIVFLVKILMKFRSSRPEGLSKKGALRNFAKFTAKHLYLSLFLNKVAGLFYFKRLWHRCFPVNFVKFLRNLNF